MATSTPTKNSCWPDFPSPPEPGTAALDFADLPASSTHMTPQVPSPKTPRTPPGYNQQIFPPQIYNPHIYPGCIYLAYNPFLSPPPPPPPPPSAPVTPYGYPSLPYNPAFLPTYNPQFYPTRSFHVDLNAMPALTNSSSGSPPRASGGGRTPVELQDWISQKMHVIGVGLEDEGRKFVGKKELKKRLESITPRNEHLYIRRIVNTMDVSPAIKAAKQNLQTHHKSKKVIGTSGKDQEEQGSESDHQKPGSDRDDLSQSIEVQAGPPSSDDKERQPQQQKTPGKNREDEQAPLAGKRKASTGGAEKAGTARPARRKFSKGKKTSIKSARKKESTEKLQSAGQQDKNEPLKAKENHTNDAQKVPATGSPQDPPMASKEALLPGEVTSAVDGELPLPSSPVEASKATRPLQDVQPLTRIYYTDISERPVTLLEAIDCLCKFCGVKRRELLSVSYASDEVLELLVPTVAAESVKTNISSSVSWKNVDWEPKLLPRPNDKQIMPTGMAGQPLIKRMVDIVCNCEGTLITKNLVDKHMEHWATTLGYGTEYRKELSRAREMKKRIETIARQAVAPRVVIPTVVVTGPMGTNDHVSPQQSQSTALDSSPGESSWRPFFCKLCQLRFDTNQDLTRHVQTSELHLRYFGCTICGKAFLHNKALNRHRITIHGSPPTGHRAANNFGVQYVLEPGTPCPVK